MVVALILVSSYSNLCPIKAYIIQIRPPVTEFFFTSSFTWFSLKKTHIFHPKILFPQIIGFLYTNLTRLYVKGKIIDFVSFSSVIFWNCYFSFYWSKLLYFKGILMLELWIVHSILIDLFQASIPKAVHDWCPTN